MPKISLAETIKGRVMALHLITDESGFVRSNVARLLRQRGKVFSLVAILLSIFLMLWAAWVVPTTNEDEIIVYHRLACWNNENAHLSTLDYSCNDLATNFMGIIFHRSYAIIGVTSSLVYAPFFKVWPSPYSHYFAGIIFLLLFAYLTTVALGISVRYGLVPLLYFPLVYMVIHDTGPIRIALITLPVVMLSVLFALRPFSFAAKLFVAASTALLITVAIEDKPFYIYLLVPVFLLAFANAFYRLKPELFGLKSLVNSWENEGVYIVIFCMLLSLIGTSLILFGMREGPDSYFYFLARQSQTTVQSFTQECRWIVIYLMSPIAFIMKIYKVFDIMKTYKVFDDYKYLLISSISFFPIYALILYRLFCHKQTWARLIQLSFFAIIITFLVARNTWHPHHFIFLHLPLIIFLMIFASKSEAANQTVLSVLGTSVLATILLAHALPLHAHSDRSRDEVLDYLRKESNIERPVINFSSWGGYYVLSLYGPSSELVTAMVPPSLSSAQKLKNLVKESGRCRILNACYGCESGERPCDNCDMASMKELFPNTSIIQIDFNQSAWKVFGISNINNKCH
jgi:hypothetical protein